MKKRFLSIIAILFFIAGLIPSNAFALGIEADEDAPEFEKIIYYNDGTEGNGFSGVYSIVKDDKDNSCISMGLTPNITQMFKYMKNEREQGLELHYKGFYMIELDVCPKKTDHCLIFSIVDTEGSSIVPFVFSGAGKLYYSDNGQWPGALTVGSGAIDYTAGQWYNIKILIDSNNGKMTFWLNDKPWGSSDWTNGYFMNFAQSANITIDNMFFNYQADYTIKNGSQTKSDGSGQFLIDNFTYGIPKGEDTELWFLRDEIGNIYEGKNNNINLEVINNSDKKKKFLLDYKVRSYTNDDVTSGEKWIDAKAGEKITVSVPVNVDEYGFYIIYASLFDENGRELKAENMRFSVVHDNKEGNSLIKTSVHPITHGVGAPADIVDVSSKLGITGYREDFPWVHAFKEDGETPLLNVYPARWNKFADMISEDNADLLICLGPGPHNVAGATWPISMEDIKNTNALKGWEKYCENLAKLLGDRCLHYEAFNEWSIQDDVYTDATVESYAEVLKATYRGIKKGNPNAKVVGFCTGFVDLEWFDDALAALGDNPGQYFDIVSYHSYMPWGDFYPEQSIAQNSDKVREIMEKYGVGDKEVWDTEVGFTFGYAPYPEIDEKLKAAYTARTLLMIQDKYEKIYMYTTARKRDASSVYEDGFCLVSFANTGDLKYEAYPTAVALSAYNELMKGSKLTEEKIFEDGTEGVSPDDIYCYKYTLSSGKACYAVWAVASEHNVMMKFGGEDEVEVYDLYGNPKTLNSLNGSFSLKLTRDPVYIICDNPGDAELERRNVFDVSPSVSTTNNDNFTFEIYNKSGINAKVEIKPSANITINGTPVFFNGMSRVSASTSNNRKNVDAYKFFKGKNIENIRVRITDENKVYYDEKIPVYYEDVVDTDLSIVPYKNGRWQAILSLKNNKRNGKVNGSIYVETDENGSNIILDNVEIDEGEKGIFRFNIPESVGTSAQYSLQSSFKLDDGTVFKNSASTEFTNVERAKVKPIIDGNLDGTEWIVSGASLGLNTAEQTKITGWGGTDDVSGETFLMYDDENLYIAAKVTDDIHFGTDEQNRLWAMDSIQIAVAPSQAGDAPITEFSFALTDKNQGEYTLHSSAVYTLTEEKREIENVKCGAKREENITYYEIQVPWKELLPSGTAPTDHLVFSMIINENDGNGRRGWIEWGSGIATQKTAMLFKQICMGK